MSLEYIRNYYGVPAEIGRGVICSGHPGVIVGYSGPHLKVLLDKDKPGKAGVYHPTWEIEYVGMKKIRPMTAGQKRYQAYLDVSECFDSFLRFLRYRAYKQ